MQEKEKYQPSYDTTILSEVSMQLLFPILIWMTVTSVHPSVPNVLMLTSPDTAKGIVTSLLMIILVHLSSP